MVIDEMRAFLLKRPKLIKSASPRYLVLSRPKSLLAFWVIYDQSYGLRAHLGREVKKPIRILSQPMKS
jgi:hypothetical protein